MIEVKSFLTQNNIEFTEHNHPAVYTCEEAEQYYKDIPGMHCKNLFLRDKKGDNYYLVVLPAAKRMDLKKFGDIVGSSKITFGSSEALKEKLGLEPGSVSIFGLLNNAGKDVGLYIDRDVYEAEIVNFHPNVNTCTLGLNKGMFHKFLQVGGYEINIISL